jgi:hypothetical protein
MKRINPLLTVNNPDPILSQVCLLCKKLITLNEKNKSALNG